MKIISKLWEEIFMGFVFLESMDDEELWRKISLCVLLDASNEVYRYIKQYGNEKLHSKEYERYTNFGEIGTHILMSLFSEDICKQLVEKYKLSQILFGPRGSLHLVKANLVCAVKLSIYDRESIYSIETSYLAFEHDSMIHDYLPCTRTLDLLSSIGDNRASNASVIGRAIAGGVIAGSTGAVVGALSAVNKNSSSSSRTYSSSSSLNTISVSCSSGKSIYSGYCKKIIEVLNGQELTFLNPAAHFEGLLIKEFLLKEKEVTNFSDEEYIKFVENRKNELFNEMLKTEDINSYYTYGVRNWNEEYENIVKEIDDIISEQEKILSNNRAQNNELVNKINEEIRELELENKNLEWRNIFRKSQIRQKINCLNLKCKNIIKQEEQFETELNEKYSPQLSKLINDFNMMHVKRDERLTFYYLNDVAGKYVRPREWIYK